MVKRRGSVVPVTGIKVLIIYEKMGTGHLRMAGILEDILKDGRTEVIKMAGSDLVDSTGADSAVWLWNYLLKKNWVMATDILVNFLLRLLVLPLSEVASTAGMMNNIGRIGPDIIVCTADCYNKLLGQYCKERKIPFFTFITDIATFIDLVSVHSNHICYFPETARAVRSYDFRLGYFSIALNQSTGLIRKIAYVLRFYHDFVLNGFKNSIYRNPAGELPEINQARCTVIGPLAEQKYFGKKDPALLKRKYGIPGQCSTLLVASGGGGGRFVLEVIGTLSRSYPAPVNLLAVCGRDRALLEEVRALKETGKVKVIPFEYTCDFDELITVADCLVIRPSAGVFIESLLLRRPCVVMEPALANDRGTLVIIEKHGTGEICRNKEDLPMCIGRILDNSLHYRTRIDELLSGYPPSYEEHRFRLRSLVLG